MSQPPSMPYQPSPAVTEAVPEARTFGMLCHLGGLAGLIIPFGNVIAPLVFWLVKKDMYPFVDRHGKEALNFQISITIYAVISGILFLVIIGAFLLPLVGLFSLIMSIVAGIKANSGEEFRYPLCIRLIK